MPNKLIGTLIALFIFGSALSISIIILTPCHANAQLSALSEIQNSVFHLSIKDYNMGITSETFKTDKYIDNWQAQYLSDLSKPALNTPADDNYPFSLVDSYLLDTDLEIDYDYDNIICSAYPQKTYLSRNNYSIADFTDTKVPPTYSINKIEGKNPISGEKVTAMHLETHNYELFVNEMRHKSVTPGEDCYISDIQNTYIRSSGQHTVWVRLTDTPLMKKCNPPVQNSSCLHPSDIRPKPEPFRIIRIPFAPCPNQQPPLILSPRSHCYYPFPPERDSAAATNWSYNYNLRNGSASSNSASTNSTRSVNTPQNDSSCQTCK